ncbi:putative HTH-type transcriptional regulator YdfH [Methylibium sp. T29]|nr:putative HTH-type transcriptional regulator YdfH [Methylibium sp. T29]
MIDQRLPPGTRLREEELAQAFAVSRTVVRQALHRLAQDGIIVLQPNRGARVPEPTRRDGEHVFDARRVVECEVVRRLAGKLSAAQLAELRALVAAEERATRSQNKQEAIRLSGRFHLELARLSGNPIFLRLLEELLPTTSLLMALYKAPGEPMCVAHSHRRLLAGLERDGGGRRGDGDAPPSQRDRALAVAAGFPGGARAARRVPRLPRRRHLTGGAGRAVLVSRRRRSGRRHSHGPPDAPAARRTTARAGGRSPRPARRWSGAGRAGA